MQKHSWKPAHLRYLMDSESCDMACGMPRSTQPLSGVLPPLSSAPSPPNTQPLSGVLPPRSSAPSPPNTGSLPPSVAPGSWLSLDGASGIRLRRMSQLDDDVISAARPTDRPIQRMRGRRRPIVRDDVTTCCGKRRVNKSSDSTPVSSARITRLYFTTEW